MLAERPVGGGGVAGLERLGPGPGLGTEWATPSTPPITTTAMPTR